MKYAGSAEALIGSTPLVDLSALVDGKATILGKYEATNPGGSVKDRMARAMLDAAEADGTLQPASETKATRSPASIRSSVGSTLWSSTFSSAR